MNEIEIQVNGTARQVPAEVSIRQLVTLLGFQPELVAVEVNRELVRRAQHAERTIAAGDRVEIVEFVGGG